MSYCWCFGESFKKLDVFITYIWYFSMFVGTVECESWHSYGDVRKRKECYLIRTYR